MSFTAKYPGACHECGTPIRTGQHIESVGRRKYRHVNCRPSGSKGADSEYRAGLQDGHRYSQEVKAYGRGLADRFAMDDELARFNRGDDY